ncbi:MAG: hypothetical protein WCP09_03100 [Candidatus Taylorbacteria bacterium]
MSKMVNADNITVCDLTKIFFTIAFNKGMTPIKRTAWNTIFRQLKKLKIKGLLVPKCVKNLAVSNDVNVEPAELVAAFASIHADKCTEVLIPSFREYVEQQTIDVWEAEYEDMIKHWKPFLLRAESIICQVYWIA